MLVIKIELWPRGDHTRARSLGMATIANVGGTVQTGNYDCKLFKSPEYSTQAETRPVHEMLTRPKAKELWRKGVVTEFPRQKLGPWDLLFRALGSLITDRSPGVEFDADVRGDSFGQAPHLAEGPKTPDVL